MCINYGKKKYYEIPTKGKEEIKEEIRIYNRSLVREERRKMVLELLERKNFGKEVIPSDCFVL